METTNDYNWIEDFGTNEMLHSGAQELAGVFSRLAFNNPLHPEAETWRHKSLTWATYDRSIKDMVLTTKENAEAEINKIAAELKSTLSLEQSLIGDNIEA